MEQLVEQLLRSPKLEIYYEQIGAALAREKSARELFLETITENDKAEFINGETIVHSPARYEANEARRRLCRLASTFVDLHRLGRLSDEKLLVSLTRNDYEPDISYWRSAKSAEFEPKQLRFPAPDWIAEVLSPSTEANDRGVKFEDYAAHGVAEYWIVDADKQTVEQYVLGDGQYQLLLKSGSGMISAQVIDGFCIPIPAVFHDAENLSTLGKMFGSQALTGDA